jgi:hypothetical protein
MRKSPSNNKVRYSKKHGGTNCELTILDLLSDDLSNAYPELKSPQTKPDALSRKLQLERLILEQKIDALQIEKAQNSRQLALLNQFNTTNPDEAFVKLLKDSSDTRVMKQTMFSNLTKFYECWDSNWTVMKDVTKSHIKMHDHISLWLHAFAPDHSKEFIINDLAISYRGGYRAESPVYDPSALIALNSEKILMDNHLNSQVTKACAAERDRLTRKHLRDPPVFYLANVAKALERDPTMLGKVAHEYKLAFPKN